MNEIQTFQDAFVVDFDPRIADQLLGRMQSLYGTLFENKFGEFDPQELQIMACTVLNGITPQQFKNGIIRMNSEKWCPSLPEFRSWCIDDNEFWTAEQAWAKAIKFTQNPESEISTIAKKSLDDVQQILLVEGQKAAHRAFCDIYSDYLKKERQNQQYQAMWVPDERLNPPKKDAVRYKARPVPNHLESLVQQLKHSYKKSGVTNGS
ncbi:restriction endonuclease [Acinetobacter ursingii]|uniref:restriction endonuclease n=1 Tax=Acinetobacter ursingii TaxID=108980 RepID=UPI00300BF8D0